MKKTVLLGILSVLLFVQCNKSSKTDPFLIKENAIGQLTSSTKIKQLDSIFASDSIVKTHSSPNAIETQGEVEVYEKGGKKLLLLSPKIEIDPNSTISDVLIHDSRYKTETGLTRENTFKDFTKHYTVENVYQILNGVMVFFSDTDLYLTIDAKYLLPEVRGDRSAKLTAEHIEENAPIKYLRLDWGSDN